MYWEDPALKRERRVSEGEEDRNANSESCSSAPRWVWTFGWMAVLAGSWESTLE